MINKQFLLYRTKAEFEQALRNGDINRSSIVFIKNPKYIWTQGEYFTTTQYQEIYGTPNIPKKISDLVNDVDYTTTDDLQELQDNILSVNNEDITSVAKNLKFANKKYDPENYSGLGRMYLRKNFFQTELTEVINEDGITFEDGVFGKQIPASTIFGTTSVWAYLSVNHQSIANNSNYVITLTKYKDGNVVKSMGIGIFNEEISANHTSLSGWFRDSYIPFVVDDDYDIIILEVKKQNGGEMNQTDVVTLSIKTRGTGNNALVQGMINKPNTIYHIQYDYDLNGQTITIPEGCTLEFEGGSFANGKVVFTDTIVNGSANAIFKNIQKVGNYKDDTSYLTEADLDNYYNKEDSDKRYIGIGEDRPVLTAEDAGRRFFDTTTGLIIWNGTKWVDTKGMTAGVHKGNTEYRGGMPIGTLTEADWYGALDSTPEFNGFKNGVAQTQGDGAGTGTPRAIYFDRIRGKFLFESEDPNIPGNYLYWEKWVGSTYRPFTNPTHGTIYKENDNYWKYIAPKTNATLKLDSATDIGYEYFDTDLSKMVYAKSIATDGTASWVDANGISC